MSTLQEFRNPTIPDACDGMRRPEGFSLENCDRGHFAHRTHEIPRPSPATHPGTSERLLQTLQRQWDNAEYQRRLMAKSKREFEAKRADELEAKRKAQEAATEQNRLRIEAEALEPARKAFLAAGGSESEWEAARDEIAIAAKKRAAIEAAGRPSGIPGLISRHSA